MHDVCARVCVCVKMQSLRCLLKAFTRVRVFTHECDCVFISTQTS